jgi:hypothetical protein
MAPCPACNHDVATPFFLNLDAWRHLNCPDCQARLEMNPRPVAVWFLPIFLSLFWFSRLGHIFAVIAEVLIASATVTLVLLLIVRPQVRLRKRALPEPTIRLNSDGSSK